MRKLDILYSVLEYVLAFMFIRGGFNILTNEIEPLTLPGLLTYLVGDAAIFVYGAAFLLTGLLLLYGKWMKQRRIHKFSLLVMYLTCIYVLVLAILLNGMDPGLLITVAVGLTAAALWVRFKFVTEYLDHDQFKQEVSDIRDELEEE